MAHKHVKKKTLGDQIYNNTTAEYDSKKYRQNIAVNWLSINQKEPPENYTPTIIESERHRSNIQHVPRKKPIPSQTKPSKRLPNRRVDDFALNFDNNDPNDDFFNQENQFEFEENRRPTHTNTKPISMHKRKNDNNFLNVEHSSEQKKRRHEADWPVKKKSKANPIRERNEDNYKSISQARMPDLGYSSIEQFPTDDDFFENVSPSKRESGNHRRKGNHNFSANFPEMGKERKRSREIMQNRKINDVKRSPRKTPHSNSFRNMERDFDMPQASTPVKIVSEYQPNLKIPRERKQRRYIEEKIADDFEQSFTVFDKRTAKRVAQKTDKQIDLTKKSLVKAERAMDRELEVFHNDLMTIPNHYTRHDEVMALRTIKPHSTLPKPSAQSIVYNIKCNNVIITPDFLLTD